jgi:hypothetical protein
MTMLVVAGTLRIATRGRFSKVSDYSIAKNMLM